MIRLNIKMRLSTEGVNLYLQDVNVIASSSLTSLVNLGSLHVMILLEMRKGKISRGKVLSSSATQQNLDFMFNNFYSIL